MLEITRNIFNAQCWLAKEFLRHNYKVHLEQRFSNFFAMERQVFLFGFMEHQETRV